MGAGVSGLCLARQLALLGIEVQLLEILGEGSASRAASGLLQTAGGRISASHLALRQACRKGYREFLDSLDPGLALRHDGHLRLGSTPSGRASFAATLRGLDLVAHAYEGVELNALAPSVKADGAVWLDDAAVDPTALLEALEASLTRLGVRRSEARIVSLKQSVGFDERGGTWSADAVALACGPGLANLLGAEWSFREEEGWGAAYTGNLELAQSLEGVGQTLVPTSSHCWRIGGNAPWTGDPPMRSLVDWQGQEISRVRGVRCSAPDGLPLAGLWRPGVYVLGGLGRNGLLTAPLLAQGLAQQMVSGTAPSWLVPFSPLRPHVGQRRSWSR